MNSTIQLFIPYLHANDSRKFVIDTFHNMAIGKVFHIDMKQRVTKKSSFSFAFIKIRLYNTDCSIDFMNEISNKGNTRLQIGRFGRKKISWIVKEYIKREDRGEPFAYLYDCDISTIVATDSLELSLSWDNDNENIEEIEDIVVEHEDLYISGSTVFTKEDIILMNQEFEDLENLILEERQRELVM